MEPQFRITSHRLANLHANIPQMLHTPGHAASLVVSTFLTFAVLGALPGKAGPCILPIEGEEPMSEVEVRQPSRLAWNPITLPGYAGLLLRPINRQGPPEF